MPNILSHLPATEIIAAFNAAAGNEIQNGKFDHPESSAALAANTFGLFLTGAHPLPPFSVWPEMKPFHEVGLEVEMRFPWSGGRHPWLDTAAKSIDCLVGIESKRFEPFRGGKKGKFAKTYWRDVWGDDMVGFQALRDSLHDGDLTFKHLDAPQLVKHALGLKTQAKEIRKPYLLYLFAEPKEFANGRAIKKTAHMEHRREISVFADCVAGDVVTFAAMSYDQLLTDWRKIVGLKHHAAAVRRHFL